MKAFEKQVAGYANMLVLAVSNKSAYCPSENPVFACTGIVRWSATEHFKTILSVVNPKGCKTKTREIKKEKHRKKEEKKPKLICLLTNPMLLEEDHCFSGKDGSNPLLFLRYVIRAPQCKFFFVFRPFFSAQG